MINSLFDKRTMKRFDDLANKEAKLNNKKKNLVKETMEKIDAVTLVNVFKIVKKNGHPSEQKRSEEIEQKYVSGEELSFNDLMNTMYILRKKNINYIEKKLVDQCGLKLCFKNKKERIFKNDEVLITCKKKYISILFYDEAQKSKAYNIANRIS